MWDSDGWRALFFFFFFLNTVMGDSMEAEAGLNKTELSV